MPGRDGCLGWMDEIPARDEMPGLDGSLGGMRCLRWMPMPMSGRGEMPGRSMPIFDSEIRDGSLARKKKDENSAIKHQDCCLPCRRRRCTCVPGTDDNRLGSPFTWIMLTITMLWMATSSTAPSSADPKGGPATRRTDSHLRGCRGRYFLFRKKLFIQDKKNDPKET